MVKTFSAQFDDIIAMNEKRLIALARESNQRLIDRTQTPTAKGGRMRVDTGFLRASGQASLTGLPSGPARPETATGSFDWSETTVFTILGRLKLGTAFHFGWSADYAAAREKYDGFLDTALQDWQEINNEVIREIKGKIK